jgi:hypothetical protein
MFSEISDRKRLCKYYLVSDTIRSDNNPFSGFYIYTLNNKFLIRIKIPDLIMRIIGPTYYGNLIAAYVEAFAQSTSINMQSIVVRMTGRLRI